MKFSIPLFVVALVVISTNAAASVANQFDYLGISFQKNNYDSVPFSPNINTANISPLNYNESLSGVGFRVFVGHQFNKYLALEAGISSFGKADFSVKEPIVETDVNTKDKTIHKGSFKTLAGDLRIVGTYPLSKKTFLKVNVGAVAWDNDMTVLTQKDGDFATIKNSDTGVSLLTGLGIGYGFNRSIAMSLDFEKTEISDVKNKNLSLSFMVRF